MKVLLALSASGSMGKAEVSVLNAVESADRWVRRCIKLRTQPKEEFSASE